MNGLTNFVNLIQSQWTNILVVVAILFGVIRTGINYYSMSKEQRTEAALTVVKSELLKLMSHAELQWSDIKKSGSLKRSQVIKDIYTQFPFLASYIDQETLLKRLYEMIDTEMENMNKILNNDKNDKPE